MKPIKYRRLTKAEASRLGVSYSAKRQVRADIKRVTGTTKLYTNREAAQAKLGKTKEKYSAFRHTTDKYGIQTFNNVKPSEHWKLQKIAGMKKVQIYARGPVEKKKIWGGSQPEGKESGSEIGGGRSFGFTGDRLKKKLDELYSPRGYLGFSSENKPLSVTVYIYHENS